MITAAGRVEVLPCGPRAVLLECDAGSLHVARVAAAAAGVDGVVQIVPGARTVLVEHDGRPELVDRLREAITVVGQSGDATTTRREVEIAVVYDGDDLADVASAAGLTVDEVVALHADAVYTVGFCGFSPGFAYLDGLLDPLAAVGRRDTPRTRVPAGSVAIAAGYTAVYPSASPGGWHLIGHTSAVLWDPTADEPALLTPGTAVRFVRVRS